MRVERQYRLNGWLAGEGKDGGAAQQPLQLLAPLLDERRQLSTCAATNDSKKAASTGKISQ